MQEIAEKLQHLKIQLFVQIIVLAAIERLRRRRKSKKKSKISSSSDEDEYKSSQIAAATFDNKFDHACVFASYCKLFAFPTRTLEDNRSLVSKIIQQFEYSALMAGVPKISQNVPAHLRNLLTPTVTSETLLS